MSNFWCHWITWHTRIYPLWQSVSVLSKLDSLIISVSPMTVVERETAAICNDIVLIDCICHQGCLITIRWSRMSVKSTVTRLFVQHVVLVNQKHQSILTPLSFKLSFAFRGLFCSNNLNQISSVIMMRRDNYICIKLWDIITGQCHKFNGGLAVNIMAWMGNYIPHKQWKWSHIHASIWVDPC